MTELKQASAPQNPAVDPSADFAPSRPTLRWILIALVLAGCGFSIANWPQVSAFAHIQQIEHALHIG